MPTPDQGIPSYAQLADLKATIEGNWRLFQQYLLPMDIWRARMEEIGQIRHRIAHFRTSHHDDLPRVVQFLRDIDKGMWRFCTSYNDARPILPPSADPVVEQFLSLDQFPWSRAGDGEWARFGIADPEALFGMTIEVLRRSWVAGDWPSPVAGAEGYLYDVSIHARQHREFNCARFLQDTHRLHQHFVHVHPDGPTGIRVTIPAVLGEKAVSDAIRTLLRWISNALLPTIRLYMSEDADERLAEEWPEYVLGPGDPLSVLSPDMPCSLFGV